MILHSRYSYITEDLLKQQRWYSFIGIPALGKSSKRTIMEIKERGNSESRGSTPKLFRKWSRVIGNGLGAKIRQAI